MASRPSSLRVGTGSAWWGDQIEPARLNAERGDLNYFCFGTMAEATISAGQVRKRRDPDLPGYDTYLDNRIQAVLPGCLRRALVLDGPARRDRGRAGR